MNSNQAQPDAIAAATTPLDSRSRRLSEAQDPALTPFDYIVIGSGAGGGPLAARLAEHGKCVLVLEAGTDPALTPTAASSGSPAQGGAGPGEVYFVPGYHGAATEDPAMCWSFSVRHYADDALQRKDRKYFPAEDPSAGAGSEGSTGGPSDQGPAGKSGVGRGGILYPRSSGLGGCTGHFAMIIIRPNDCDWNDIAEVTGDRSWRAENMQGYFGRIENCLYYQSYEGFLRKILYFYELFMRGLAVINPRWSLDRGGHGLHGWQKTSFIDPELVRKIALGDKTFLRLLFGALFFLWTRTGQLRALLGSLLRLQIVQYLDPNFGTDRADRSGRAAFIPIATDGTRRLSLRERLLGVAAANPDKLVLQQGVLATRLIFRREPAEPWDGAEVRDSGEVRDSAEVHERAEPRERAGPRAIGVEVQQGLHLYQASPLHTEGATATPTFRFFAREEVIVAAGAFNTPQLLMLSGIGDAAHLRALGIAGPRDEAGSEVSEIVDLPGVGLNLQDRYEVSVISQTRQPFSTLNTVSFRPGDQNDQARKQWLKDGQGLYTTNGGALAFFYKSTQAANDEPDLFIFGAPAAFRGYYWGWSKELLHARMGAKGDQRDLWSWILLKAYTRNRGGTVRLLTTSAFSQPEINFHSFAEGCEPAEAQADAQALAEGVEFVRRLNEHAALFREEVQPGNTIKGPSLASWIQNEAWGHHACGTCRMGADAWQRNVTNLSDRNAVLDSAFRVHGVAGLRVVDTSAFPKIPGYFIVTPTFMIGEKAADVLLADSETYPPALERAEATAISLRRQRARVSAGPPGGEAGSPDRAAGPGRMPADAIGLALSGGGVRSATFCLGVLQSLARKNRLRLVDFISSVSGGGYIGAFLGRLYSRLEASVTDPAGRAQSIVSNIASYEIWWLRSHARYLTGAGRTDLETNAGTIWRNLLSVHVCVGLVSLASEALLHWIASAVGYLSPEVCRLGTFHDIPWSPWRWAPIAVLLVAVLPAWFSFWLAPKPGTTASLSVGGLAVWLLALAGSLLPLSRIITSDSVIAPTVFVLPLTAIAVLLLAWVWQEAALWGITTAREPAMRGILARNRLSRGAGVGLGLLGLTIVWVLIDTLAGYAVCLQHEVGSITVTGILAASLPMLRALVMRFLQTGVNTSKSPTGAGSPPPKNQKTETLLQTILLGAVAFTLVSLLIFGLDVIVYWVWRNPARGPWLLIGSAFACVVLGRTTGFVNLSSLQALYAARLARTYLGATNRQRIYARAGTTPKDVDAAHPDDDVFLHAYHPERTGGPLHLINVCVNETADVTSGRQLAEDKGLPMCLGPQGVSVGTRFHALWDAYVSGELRMGERVLRRLLYPVPVATPDLERPALRAIRTTPDPEAFHVLASKQREWVAVESLRLSEWMAISGAAISTGEGRQTSLPRSLLLGLFNVRLGYWWNSRIGAGERPGSYPPPLWRWLKSLPGYVFRTQALILNEWRGYFAGPSQRLWYLSDGGHSENTGVYELIRRRVAFIIAVDAGRDPGYVFDDMALLIRRVRLDFGAELKWIDPTDARSRGYTGWDALTDAAGVAIPAWIRNWLKPAALGSVDRVVRRGTFAAALAHITYRGSVATSWLVLLKPCLPQPPPVPLDVQCYSKGNDAFPNQSTVDQFFTDDQWESYRLLGETLTGAVIDDATI